MGCVEPDCSGEDGIGRWWICGLLLLALMLNYMDRQTLALTIVPISRELGLSNTQYGTLEKGFAYAFAVGGLLCGWLADRVSVRWLFPAVLISWSCAGLASGHADVIGDRLAPWIQAVFPGFIDPSSHTSRAYLGFLVCRTALGFFESGQWPCALVATQRLLSDRDRPFGNGLLQSGASVGAILTPLVVQLLVSDRPGSWRSPYVVIGAAGILWVGPWLWLLRGVRLDPLSRRTSAASGASAPRSVSALLLVRRIVALCIVVVAINSTWHFFRAWLPKMLEEFHGYSAGTVRYFCSAYYLSADLGCISAGLAVKLLTSRRVPVHASRLAVFLACALVTSLSTVAAGLQRGPLLLLLLLLVGFGSLGLFPNYYSLTQDLSTRHQGKLTGLFGFVTWVVTAEMQQWVGIHVDRTHSYSQGIFWAGLAPVIAFFALCLLWGRTRDVEFQPRMNSDSAGP